VLAGGLTFQAVDIPSTRACSCVIAFDAGSRVEDHAQAGISHFVEHLVFKGGVRYPNSRAISRATQRLGAYLNGYITSDLVALHVTVRVEHALAAVDLLTDIVGDSRLDARDVELERDIVADEIGIRRDRPNVLADELIDAAVFGEHPLGRSVTGRPEVVRELTSNDLLRFRARYWSPQRAVVVISGNLAALPETAELEPLLARITGDGGRTVSNAPDPSSPRTMIEHRPGSRAFIRLAYPINIDVRDARSRAALKVLAAILGAPMGSRLSDELRDARGLCYSIFAGDRTTSDAALLKLSAESSAGNCGDVLAAMCEIVDRIRLEPPSEDEVELAREGTAGRRILALEQTRAVAQYAARQWVQYGETVDPEDAVRSIESVTAQDVARAARSISADCAIACVVPPGTDVAR
jgi:predicted Zn-dependent peptidase